MEDLKILQVVGYKNSGKTSLILELIRLAVLNQKQVATVKHHGHGGALEMPAAETDSMRFYSQGAAASIVYDGGMIQQHIRKEEAAVEDLIAMAAQSDIDMVFVEGFKAASYEKIVLIRSEEEWQDLKMLHNIALVLVHEGVFIEGAKTIERNNNGQIAAWFSAWMEGEVI